MIIDTHAHIYAEEFAEDLNTMLQRASANGVGAILLPNIDATSIAPLEALAAAQPNCIPMMGLHPTYVNADWQKELTTIEAQLFAAPHRYCAEIIALSFLGSTPESDHAERSPMISSQNSPSRCAGVRALSER